MSSPTLQVAERVIGLRRPRGFSSTDQLHHPKRQRPNRLPRFIPPLLQDRPPSSSSLTSSVSGYYGAGDEGALENLFAAEPQRFSTIPHPHGSRGAREPCWELRSDLDMRFQRRFPHGVRRSDRIRVLIPGPEVDPFSSPSPPPAYSPPTTTSANFESAMILVRRVIGENRHLTRDVAMLYEYVREWREAWGWSPLPSEEYESPPPYSSRRDLSEIVLSPTEAEQSELSVRQSSSPSPTQIPNPSVPGEPFLTIEALLNSVNIFAKENGFGIVRRNAYAYKGRKLRYSLQCDRFGLPRAKRGTGLRQRKSRKCGCQWMVIAEALEEGRWLLRQHPMAEHGQHNHGPSIKPSAHPSHRRTTSSIRDTIESTSRRVGIRARDVRAVVQEQHPDSVLTQRDVYNARARINREKLDGYSATASLIKLFDEKNIPYIVKWSDDNLNRLVGLVWTFPYCIQMWKRFPEVISFDNTYNTNRFKLPLFQATGQTCLKTVFNAAFGLIDNERREGFQFLAEGIHQLLVQNSIRLPNIIITDFDNSMKAAFNDQFPSIQQQLCIHHINSNVLLRSKQKWVKDRNSSSSSDTDDKETDTQPSAQLNPQDRQLIHAPADKEIPHTYRGVLAMWKLVLFAETEATHEEVWRKLCDEFDDQRPILRYLHGTYMSVRAQWARCFIRKYGNFGIRVTSGTEASNNNIKSYLLNGISHLYRLVEAMQDMIRDQERDFTDACALDEVLASREFIGPGSEYLGELRTVLSSKGLQIINQQYRIARKAMPTGKNPFPESLGECSDDCTVSVELGVPCCHRVYEKLASATQFSKWEVHPHWRLRESSSTDPYRRILDPKIVISLRGRPRNTTETIPARLAIQANQAIAYPPTSQALTQQSSLPRRGRPPGSKNKSTIARLEADANQTTNSQASSLPQRQTRSQVPILGPGKTTGIRASGRQMQPSIRRRRCEWELLSSDEGVSGRLRKAHHAPPVPAGPSSQSAQQPSLRYDAPERIYQRYITARTAWCGKQSTKKDKTDKQYRKAIGLPLKYTKQDYRWCQDYKQMSSRRITSTGSRDWTQEEMNAYLDWSKAEDDRVEAQVVEDMGKEPMRNVRRGMTELWRNTERDSSAQQAVYDAEECIAVESE